MATTLTQAGLEKRFTVSTVARFLGDGATDIADPDLVRECLEEAEAVAKSLLLKGFDSLDRVVQVLQNDPQARGAAYDIAAGIMSRRHQEFLTAGTEPGKAGPYDPMRRAAEKTLEMIASSERRSIAEKMTAGQNEHVAFAPNPSPAPRVFASSRATAETVSGILVVPPGKRINGGNPGY